MEESKEKELDTTPQTEKSKLMHEKEEAMNSIARQLRIKPSLREVLSLPKDLLLKHNALIALKASSLSSTKRKMVQERVSTLVKLNKITTEEVEKEVKELQEFVLKGMNEAFDKSLDEKSTEE